MEITLCDYDFSGLYKAQKKAFDRTALPKYIDPDQVPRSGAVWCIDGFYLSDNGDFSQKVQQYGLWSREQSMGKERFCKSVDDLDQLMPQSSKDIWAYVLLLDRNHRSVGYTILTS